MVTPNTTAAAAHKQQQQRRASSGSAQAVAEATQSQRQQRFSRALRRTRTSPSRVTLGPGERGRERRLHLPHRDPAAAAEDHQGCRRLEQRAQFAIAAVSFSSCGREEGERCEGTETSQFMVNPGIRGILDISCGTHPTEGKIAKFHVTSGNRSITI